MRRHDGHGDCLPARSADTVIGSSHCGQLNVMNFVSSVSAGFGSSPSSDAANVSASPMSAGVSPLVGGAAGGATPGGGFTPVATGVLGGGAALAARAACADGAVALAGVVLAPSPGG